VLVDERIEDRLHRGPPVVAAAATRSRAVAPLWTAFVLAGLSAFLVFMVVGTTVPLARHTFLPRPAARRLR
jgi:bacteriorhodopsin